jgi:uncharacterized protein involved in exopolysaccharide biosynthesis
MLKAQKEAHQTEMSTELTQTLTSQEQRRLEELNTKIEQMRERLSTFSTSRSEVCKSELTNICYDLLIYINVA